MKSLDDYYAALPIVSADERCAKCGSFTPLMKFDEGGFVPYTGTNVPPLLTLTCFRCGCRWLRRPLDAHVAEKAS